MKSTRNPAEKSIAVVLAGCGNKDGSEITEAVSLIIALSQYGAKVSFFAPQKSFTPLNFLTGEGLDQKRDTMIEAARITRSQIRNLEELNPSEFSALALPGGYGAATHLSDWAEKGARCSVLPSLEKKILEFYQQSKPIAAVCIAPVLVAKVLGSKGITVTIGAEGTTAAEIQKTGAYHEACPVTDFISDRDHKVLTTPAYMYSATPYEVFTGISKLAKELVEIA